MPVFIAGMPRSGTTLVEQIIDAHPDAVGGGELRDIDELVAGLTELGIYPSRLGTLPEHKLRRFADAYRKTLARVLNLENADLFPALLDDLTVKRGYEAALAAAQPLDQQFFVGRPAHPGQVEVTG